MRLIYSDGVSITTGGPIEIMRLNGNVYVVARGYLCQVESEAEGLELITRLEASREKDGQDFEHT